MNIPCDLISISRDSSSLAWGLTISWPISLPPSVQLIFSFSQLLYCIYLALSHGELLIKKKKKHSGCETWPSLGAAEIPSLAEVIREREEGRGLEGWRAHRGPERCG